MSNNSKTEMAVWRLVKIEREALMVAKLGYPKCEYCLKAAITGTLDAHHLDGNRRHNSIGNCRLVHRHCHSYIHDHNVKEVPSLL